MEEKGKIPKWHTTTYDKLDSKINDINIKLHNKMSVVDTTFEEILEQLDQLSRCISWRSSDQPHKEQEGLVNYKDFERAVRLNGTEKDPPKPFSIDLGVHGSPSNFGQGLQRGIVSNHVNVAKADMTLSLQKHLNCRSLKQISVFKGHRLVKGKSWDLMEVVDPDATHTISHFVIKQLAFELRDEFLKAIENNWSSKPYDPNHKNMARHALKNTTVAYLASLEASKMTKLALNDCR
eukprot:Gb_32135 [translate_table: standard]